jgi:hypothetical protein
VCSAARPSANLLWPPNHAFVPIQIAGVQDPDGDPLTLNVTSIQQSEPVDTTGDGRTEIDGAGVGTANPSVRAERSGKGLAKSGRLYFINFTATDTKQGACSGTVVVGVPHDQGQRDLPSDTGQRYDSITGVRIR